MAKDASGNARARILARRRRFVALALGALAGQGCSGSSGEPARPPEPGLDARADDGDALPEGWHVMDAATQPPAEAQEGPERLPADARSEPGQDVMVPGTEPDRQVVVRVCLSIVPVAPVVGFSPGRHQLDAQHRVLLDEVAKILRENPDRGVIVAGHAAGNEPGGEVVSARRARTVVDALLARGVARGQLCPVAEGSRKPLAAETNADGRAKNRRVDFILRDAGEPCPRQSKP